MPSPTDRRPFTAADLCLHRKIVAVACSAAHDVAHHAAAPATAPQLAQRDAPLAQAEPESEAAPAK